MNKTPIHILTFKNATTQLNIPQQLKLLGHTFVANDLGVPGFSPDVSKKKVHAPLFTKQMRATSNYYSTLTLGSMNVRSVYCREGSIHTMMIRKGIGIMFAQEPMLRAHTDPAFTEPMLLKCDTPERVD